MTPRKFGDQPREAEPIRPVRCRECRDFGFVYLDGAKPAVFASELFELAIPCLCEEGDQFRNLWAIAAKHAHGKATQA